MAFCSKCGNELKDTDKFCKACGTRNEAAFSAESTDSTKEKVPLSERVKNIKPVFIKSFNKLGDVRGLFIASLVGMIMEFILQFTKIVVYDTGTAKSMTIFKFFKSNIVLTFQNSRTEEITFSRFSHDEILWVELSLILIAIGIISMLLPLITGKDYKRPYLRIAKLAVSYSFLYYFFQVFSNFCSNNDALNYNMLHFNAAGKILIIGFIVERIILWLFSRHIRKKERQIKKEKKAAQKQQNTEVQI